MKRPNFTHASRITTIRRTRRKTHEPHTTREDPELVRLMLADHETIKRYRTATATI
ncbi:hypothetical protein BISA_1891 [Bifidobacterium saguini DSM 23967]|uniref:Uncharacterized protein n=1 Tax=Bifidobacterium saguini DSM 23967 TaxID=1437607 RepID=A0A087D6Y8_9BIFI|nr:hypothetical protein [Bifidobacterium saguini]KFI91288.1 hypothetical protein BISA_1891 [Bifidobacterium saguini DSM 23967]